MQLYKTISFVIQRRTNPQDFKDQFCFTISVLYIHSKTAITHKTVTFCSGHINPHPSAFQCLSELVRFN